MPDTLVVKVFHHQQMIEHLESCLPEEGCGLIAGSGDIAEAVLTVTNELHSPVRFRMNPTEQLEKLIWLEDTGLTLLAIFHSHPAGPDFPSETDLAEFSYPDTNALIYSKESGTWQARGYQISGLTYREIKLVLD